MQTIITSDDLVEQIDEIGIAETVKIHRKPPLPTRILRDLYELYHDQDHYLSFLAHYPLIPSDLADTIASNLDPKKTEIAIGLAGNPRCPQQSLNRLTEHSDVSVRHALAANPNLTPKEFQALVTDSNEFVRAALSQNSALPNPLQFVLAEDSSTAVRIALSERKNLDTDVAVHLANSDDAMVSAATIINYSLDEEIMQLWADDNQQQQQLLLLKRIKALPAAVHKALRTSPHPLVSRSALKDSELSGPEMLYLVQSDDTRDRIFLAEQSDLPASIQRILAQDASPRVRRRLASNNTIHESIALHIVASNDIGACRSLTKNTATSDATLRELCLHPDDDIALLVCYRDDLQPEHHDLLVNQRTTFVAAEHLAYQEIEYSNFTEEASSILASHESPSVRAFVAHSSQLNDTARNQLLNDSSPLVRRNLAKNPTLNDRQLRTLLEDADRDVTFAAEETFAQRIRQEKAAQAIEPEAPQKKTVKKRPSKGALFNKITKFFTE
ncbi:MAG: hypothetical protein ACSHYA_09740 [Opitutaceae bacterium]